MCCALLVVSIGAAPVHAGTYEFKADTGISFYGEEMDFSLLYSDADGNGKFSISELVPGSFKGFGILNLGGGAGTVVWFDTIVLVPVYHPTKSKLTDGPGTGGAADEFPVWIFSSSWVAGDTGPMDASWWAYSQTEVAPVPLPPSVFLLASGLIPLAWARRKRPLGK